MHPDDPLNELAQTLVNVSAAQRSPVGRRYAMVLPPHALQRIARALEMDDVSVIDCSPEELLQLLREPRELCVVLDPTRLDEGELATAAALLRDEPRPVVIYPPLTPAGVRTGLGFAREVGGLIAFQATEEDFQLLVQNILSVGHPSDARFVLHQLAPRLAQLPERLREAIVAMFTIESGVSSPQALARRAAMSRRSADRWLERVGITSARLLVAAPMLLRALRLLRDTRLPIRRVAKACGYSSARRFHDQAAALTGMTAVELRAAELPITAVLERIADALQEGGPVRVRIARASAVPANRARQRRSASAHPQGSTEKSFDWGSSHD